MFHHGREGMVAGVENNWSLLQEAEKEGRILTLLSLYSHTLSSLVGGDTHIHGGSTQLG